MMKILHVSDLHLDTPFVGIGKKDKELQKKLTQSPYRALERCIQLAINEQVDLILISGDIYNSDRQTIYAQHYFYSKMEELHSHDIPVVVCHGNHDYLPVDKLRVTYPENVYVFEDEEVSYFDVEVSNRETVRVYGFSYNHRWIAENKAETYPENSRETDYTIGMLHGQAYSNQLKENHYAPYTLADLKSKNYDYWALGHIHKQQIINQEPLMIYPGNIQGQHHNESGDKGCFIIELNKGQASHYEFHSLAEIIWQTESLNLEKELQGPDLVQMIQGVINNYAEESKARSKSFIINIELQRSHLLSKELYDQIEAGELYEAIKDYQTESQFVIINSIKLVLDKDFNVFEFDQELKKSFAIIIDSYLEEAYDEEHLGDLYRHPTINKYFNLKDMQTFKSEAFQKAKDLIIYRADLKLEDEGDQDDY